MADGSIEYLGRNDFQVKIRGFRIELGEIEAALLACAGVREAVVVAREDVPGEKRVVAYLVAAQADDLVERLRVQLAARLPAYMLPAAFVLLPALPLNSNGKVDRRQLPAPDYQAQELYVAPANAVEARLAEIWQQLLRVEQVGVHDNFFQMGGDSILSIQVVARANQAGIHITTRQLFEAQTIAELARLAASQAAVAAPQDAIDGVLPLLPIQQRFLDGDERDRHHFNQAVLLQTPSGFDAAALQALVAAIYRRHDALRLRFTRVDDQWQARHVPLDATMLADSCVVEPLPLQPAEQAAFVTARCSDWQTRFDLAQGPLLRAVLFAPADAQDSGRLLLAVHHIVMDGVSWRVLLADLEQAYAQHSRGEPIALRAKTSSLQQWSNSLVDYANSDDLQQERAYWLAQNDLAPAPLPLDRPTQGEGSIASTRSVTLGLDAEETRALLQECPAAYRTQVNELLLAGVFLGMREWTGSDGLRLRLEGHGREALFDQLDVTQTVGWFTSLFPLTLHCAETDTGALVKAVKEQYRAIPHHGIGYGLLRYLAAEPLPACDDDAVLEFNYLGQFDQVLGADTRFQAGRESSGAQVSPQRRRPARLSLIGKVFGGQLQFSLNYSAEQYDEANMRGLAALLENALRRVVAHCRMPGVGSYTLSDFPLARITAAQLDDWQMRYPALSRLYPATPMQAGLLFESLVDATTYVVQMMPVLQGELDLPAFRAAWQQTVQRHDALRTAFVGEGAALHQLVWDQAELPWHEEDWCGLDDVEQTRRFEAYRRRDKQAGFDFVRPPLLRLAVFRLGAQRYQLLWTYHHILSDGWSSPLVYRDVVALYQAQLQGLPAPLPPPPAYERYIAWLQRQDAEQARAHWRSLLADVDAPTPLVLDTLPGDGSHGPREQRLLLSVAETDALRALAQSQHTTVNTLLQWSWAYLLHRYSGEARVLFGATISGRAAEVAGIEQMVGLFINTIPVKVEFDGRRSVAESLRTLQQDFQRSNDYGFLSLVDMQRQSALRSGVSLFDSLLVFENYPLDAMTEAADAASGGAAAARLRIERSSSNEQTSYALTLNASLDRSLQVKCGYRAEDFAAATIERLLGHLAAVLRQLPAAVQHNRRIELLQDSERRQLQDWNATQQDYARDATIHALFEAQVQRHPGAIALVHGSESLSYAELNRRANRLARRLVALGAQVDGRVAICLERGVDMIVALLASLKAGSAYVPLDPRYPPERLAYMLADAAPSVLLTQAALRDSLPVLAAGAAPLLLLDGEDLSALADSDLHVAGLAASSLAYVIYTSGSTGQPKGVEQTHRTMVNLMTSLFSRHAVLAQPLPTLQFATLNFDMSLYEVCNALFTGSALVLIDEDDRLDFDRLFALIAREQVGRVYLPTALLQPFAHAALAQQVRLPALKLMQVAGEQLTITPTIRDWARHSGCAVLNLYGPTESHVVSDQLLEGDAVNWATLPPVGKPVANMQMQILDAQLSAVPVGIAGELYLSGDGLARGYLDRPALTAERFIEPVQDGGDRIRLYKTGDLARWLPDGTVEYLGRNDFQVKIHGFRIELGEIEARLVACAGVREAAVVALDDGPAGKRLVAYVVAQDAAQLQPAELRAALARELPDYMIPAAFVSLPALPLTANGKVDRRALPAPDAALLPGRAYAPPQGDIESAIAAVWQELLGLDQVGRDDHFFELGGHSLLVISLIERLRQRGFSLGVKAVFAAPTVRALAEVLAGAAGEAAFEVAPNRLDAATTQITPELLPLVELSQPAIDGIVAAVPGGTANIQDIYPLAPLQEGILFHHLLGGSGDAYLLRRVVGFDSRERLDAFLQALQTVIDRHDILRSAVFWQGLPKPVQVVHRRAPLPLHELALADDVPALEQLLARTDPRRTRLDLQQAPVIAAYVVPDAQSGEWLLALLNHHMVCDHVTLDLMIGEIHCLLQGQGDRLAEPLPYRNFIARTHTVPEAVHEAYFRAQLGDIDTPVAPFGVLDVQSDAQAVSEVRIALDDNLAQRIREQSRRCGVTPAVLFHVAWAQVLGRCTGLDDVVFGTVLSGRLQGSEGADQVVGLFINTLPLRVGLAGIGVRDAVAEVYRRLGELLTHEQASLALAQRCSAVSPALPLFTALLNYRHIHNIGTPADMAWQGMRSLDASARNSYPLTMSVEDRGQAFGLTAQCQQGIDGAHLAGYLESVIAALVDKLESDPAFPLNRLELLPSAQHQQLLVQGRGPASLRWRGLALPLQIEQQVQRTPQAVALRCGDTQLSYAQLDARANRLAHALIEQGIGRGARVGIHRERSPELLIALLAVLKTGAAYVVLDHRQTTARLRAIIADAGVSVALLDSRHSVLPVGGVDALYLDDAATDAQWLAEYPSTRPDIAIADDDSAYVLYTSGSTGTPKGVEILHRGLTDYCAFAREGYYAASLSGSLVVTSPAFDLTVPSLYVPLLTGGCVELIAADDDLAGFAARLEQADMPPVLLRLTPSHLQGLLQLADEAPRQTAHVFVIGGEAFGVDLARQLQAKYPQAQIYNHYGPTETVVGCSWYDVTANLADLQRTIPIGRAMSNTSLYVLDPQARLQPPGVAGELYIGGAGVAKGYLNQPELTAAKFVADPFEAGGRLYRSGDRVRWRHDGTLEFLGRLDDQVKLRGFRIELGDIESALRRHTSVRDAVAVVREGGEGGEAQLVAYVVADPADGLADSLKAQLAEQLPAYMQPSAYVVLARLPLTPNGKVDKGALPRPEQQAKQYISPETETEKILAAVWAGLLGLDVGRIGAGDNFFELGGHSILSIRLVVQLGERFPLPLGVRDLFRYPELRQLAAYLDTATPLRDGAWNPLVLLGSQQAGAALYCVPAAGLTAASYQALAQALQPQLALNVFEPRGFDAAQPPCADMDEIVRCNLQALREHQPRGPYHLAGHSFGGGVAFEMARELEAQGEQVELLLLDSMLYLQEQQRGGRSALSHLRQMFADEDEATAVADTPASDAAFRARFEGRLRQAGLLPLRGDDALLDKYIAAFDTQLALYSAYRPSGLLQGPVSLLLAKGGLARLDRDALVQHYGRCCAQLAEVAVVAGGHLSMLSPEHVQSLAWVMLQHTQAMPAAVVA
ncbi:amino acid adenylation domain-containing protein [Tahibacter aquaticus]|uniref:amino acid adenylation domain-containing protein n=1 Tax=Tahibacter aquaticus TaxID=520092 RepID=UPI003132E518